MNDKRYNLWKYATEADDSGPLYIHWRDAYEDLRQAGSFGQGSLHDMGFRIWDYSTTPPTDVTENNPEAVAPTAPAPTIPEAVNEITIKRYAYGDDRDVLTANIKGEGWHMHIMCRDAELLTRINEIAAAMEAVTK